MVAPAGTMAASITSSFAGSGKVGKSKQACMQSGVVGRFLFALTMRAAASEFWVQQTMYICICIYIYIYIYVHVMLLLMTSYHVTIIVTTPLFRMQDTIQSGVFVGVFCALGGMYTPCVTDDNIQRHRNLHNSLMSHAREREREIFDF